jgi:hypothetical protein
LHMVEVRRHPAASWRESIRNLAYFSIKCFDTSQFTFQIIADNDRNLK